MRPSIVLVAKPGRFRDALAALMGSLQVDPLIELVDSLALAIENRARLQPDLIIADESASDGRPAELIDRLKSGFPGSSLLALVRSVESQNEATRAGATVCLVEAEPPARLIDLLDRLLTPREA